jgi:hypothetical protein
VEAIGKEISTINAAEMKCFRRIAGKTRRDRIRNERIREHLEQEGIENRQETTERVRARGQDGRREETKTIFGSKI